MGRRQELQKILERKILKSSKRVYFQPPESVKMEYPAIVYSLDYIKSQHGDNHPYVNMRRYSVTIITKDPDNDYLDRMLVLPTASFQNSFVSDNLYHYNFTIYY